jgi:hypothetical protein
MYVLLLQRASRSKSLSTENAYFLTQILAILGEFQMLIRTPICHTNPNIFDSHSEFPNAKLNSNPSHPNTFFPFPVSEFPNAIIKNTKIFHTPTICSILSSQSL